MNPLRRLYRKVRIRYSNALIKSSSAPSLLVLPDDILYLIFDLLGPQHLNKLSAANKRLRCLASPLVFHTISLGPYSNANQVYQALSTLQVCSALQQYTRSIQIFGWPPQITIQRALFYTSIGSLVDLISTRVPRLHTMEIHVTEPNGHLFPWLFHRNAPQLPSITHLTVSPGFEDLVLLCPNVTSLSTSSLFEHGTSHVAAEQKLIKLASKAQYLRHFTLHSQWTENVLDIIIRELPNLQRLGMISNRPASTFSALLRSLIKLRNLKSLHVSRRFALGDTPLEESELGEDRKFKNGLTVWHDTICRAVFRIWPDMEELTLGVAFRARLVHDSGTGKSEIKWEDVVPIWQCGSDQLDEPLVADGQLTQRIEGRFEIS